MFKSKTYANDAAKKVLKSLRGKWKLKFTYDYYGRSRKKKCYFEVSRGNIKIRQYNQRYFYVVINAGESNTYYGSSGLSLKTAMTATLQQITEASNKTKRASNKIERLINQLSQ